jgi:leucyl-tRNA---protein transferase
MDDSNSSEKTSLAEAASVPRFPVSLPIADTISNVHECSYLKERIASLPLNLPSRLLSLDEFDHCLARGIRRSGVFLYHTACDHCAACEPSRIDVRKFIWRDSFNRVLKKGDQCLTIQVANPMVDEQRLNLFNLHRTQRGLGDSDGQYRPEDYESFLVDTCLSQTVELSFWLDKTLVCVSIVDCGRISLSAVYTYFDPSHSKLSLGTYSILKQIEFTRDTERQYAYLGMYVSENRHLSYKARFTPQERWVVDRWLPFD